jgi:hypothetical protein
MVVRVPFAAAALAEARAMFAEATWIGREHAILAGATPASPEAWVSTYAEHLYSANYAAYTVAAHILANYCGSSDLREVLPYASALAWVALNATPDLAARLTLPDDWTTHWRSGATDLIGPLLTTPDCGFVFAALAATGVPLRRADS